jgi:hypothetical protein
MSTLNEGWLPYICIFRMFVIKLGTSVGLLSHETLKHQAIHKAGTAKVVEARLIVLSVW